MPTKQETGFNYKSSLNINEVSKVLISLSAVLSCALYNLYLTNTLE